MTLAEFLLARISEDERVVRYASVNAHQPRLHLDTNGYPVMDPARVLAECEAKRRIIEYLRLEPLVHDIVFREILVRLALPFADHPDYDESWRP